MSYTPQALLVYASQLAVGSVFLAASLLKVTDMTAFRQAVAGYAVLPRRLVPVVALVLVLLEFAVALALIGGYIVVIAASVAVVMLGFFASGIAVNLLRGRRIQCGCFGGRSDTISPRALFRIVLIAVPSLTLLIFGGSTVTAVTLAENGAQSLLRLVEAAGVGAFMLILGAWLLALPEVSKILSTLRFWSGLKEARPVR